MLCYSKYTGQTSRSWAPHSTTSFPGSFLLLHDSRHDRSIMYHNTIRSGVYRDHSELTCILFALQINSILPINLQTISNQFTDKSRCFDPPLNSSLLDLSVRREPRVVVRVMCDAGLSSTNQKALFTLQTWDYGSGKNNNFYSRTIILRQILKRIHIIKIFNF